MVRMLAPLPPVWETRVKVQAPGFGLASPSCRGHVDSEPADGGPLSFLSFLQIDVQSFCL